MRRSLRERILPATRRRTLEELTEDLDLRSGDSASKQSAFWTLLALSSVTKVDFESTTAHVHVRYSGTLPRVSGSLEEVSGVVPDGIKVEVGTVGQD